MAEGRLKVVGVPPSGPGLRRALAKHVKDGTIVTAFDDTKLHAFRRLVPDDREVEYAPLGDLVGRFLTMLGEPIVRLCPKGQLQAAVELACKELDADSPLAGSARFRGTAELIADRLGELRDWRIGPDDLRRAAEDAQPSLSTKLHSLAEIDESVRAVLGETNRQYASDRVERCLDIPQDRVLPIRRILVSLAGDPKPLYEDWIRWVAGFGIEVVALVDAVPGGSQFFESSKRCARRLGTSVQSSDKESWCRFLFTDETAPAAPAVEIVDCSDPLAECEWAIRGCQSEIAEGAMPHRIAVFVRDTERYSPLLMSAAERLGVPLSLNLHVPLLTNGFASLTLRCLEALSGEDVRALARLSSSSYLRTDLTKNHELIGAARAAFVQGPDQWSALAEWSGSQGSEVEWVGALLSWRETANASRAPLSTWLNRLRELVGATSMVDTAARADAHTRERDLRAQTVLQKSLSDMAYVYDRAGRPELSLASFVQFARETWERSHMVIEGRQNGVAVVTSTLALTSFDTLLVLGMLEGTLPRRRTEDPILFDDDRHELARLLGRDEAPPDSRTRAIEERDEFVRICSAATKKLVFSYPQTDDDRDNVPAFYLEAVKKACPQFHEHSRPRSQFVPLVEECKADLDVRLRKALDSPRETPEPPLLTTDAAKSVVRPQFENGVSPEELARALECPFQSASSYRLKISTPARRRLMRSLRDLPAQAELVTSSDANQARSAFRRAIDAYLQDIYPEFEEWELAMLSAAANRLADEWVDREFRAREIWQEPNEKTVTDVALGDHGLRNDLTIGGRQVKLSGRATSMTLRKNYTVLRFFDSNVPEMGEKTEIPRESVDAFKYGLYLMCQAHLPQRNPTIEVDGMVGKRILAGFSDIRNSISHDPKAGIEVVRVSDSRAVFFQNVKERLKEAIEILDCADMRATPGKHCTHCQYGELCRVSAEFGESGFDLMEDE